MTDTGDGSTPVKVSARKYTPGISDPVVNQARAAKKQARETRQANLPTGTETKKNQSTGGGDNHSDTGQDTGGGEHKPHAGCVLTTRAMGWKAGPAWQTIASLQVPTAADWGDALLHVSAQGVARSSGGKELLLRISVAGTPVADGLAAYAGPDIVVGQTKNGLPVIDLSGDRSITMGVDVEAEQGTSVTLDVYCPDNSVYLGDGNSVTFTASVNYKEAS